MDIIPIHFIRTMTRRGDRHSWHDAALVITLMGEYSLLLWFTIHNPHSHSHRDAIALHFAVSFHIFMLFMISNSSHLSILISTLIIILSSSPSWWDDMHVFSFRSRSLSHRFYYSITTTTAYTQTPQKITHVENSARSHVIHPCYHYFLHTVSVLYSIRSLK